MWHLFRKFQTNLIYTVTGGLWFLTTSIATGYVNIDKLIKIESGGNPRAVSKAGALGLCQIMPRTWKEHAKSNEHWYNSRDNKKVATRYLFWISSTLRRAGDRNFSTPSHILACYNGGIGRFIRSGFRPERMPRETRTYIKRYQELK